MTLFRNKRIISKVSDQCQKIISFLTDDSFKKEFANSALIQKNIELYDFDYVYTKIQSYLLNRKDLIKESMIIKEREGWYRVENFSCIQNYNIMKENLNLIYDNQLPFSLDNLMVYYQSYDYVEIQKLFKKICLASLSCIENNNVELASVLVLDKDYNFLDGLPNIVELILNFKLSTMLTNLPIFLSKCQNLQKLKKLSLNIGNEKFDDDHFIESKKEIENLEFINIQCNGLKEFHLRISNYNDDLHKNFTINLTDAIFLANKKLERFHLTIKPDGLCWYFKLQLKNTGIIIERAFINLKQFKEKKMIKQAYNMVSNFSNVIDKELDLTVGDIHKSLIINPNINLVIKAEFNNCTYSGQIIEYIKPIFYDSRKRQKLKIDLSYLLQIEPQLRENENIVINRSLPLYTGEQYFIKYLTLVIPEIDTTWTILFTLCVSLSVLYQLKKLKIVFFKLKNQKFFSERLNAILFSLKERTKLLLVIKIIIEEEIDDYRNLMRCVFDEYQFSKETIKMKKLI